MIIWKKSLLAILICLPLANSTLLNAGKNENISPQEEKRRADNRKDIIFNGISTIGETIGVRDICKLPIGTLSFTGYVYLAELTIFVEDATIEAIDTYTDEAEIRLEMINVDKTVLEELKRQGRLNKKDKGYELTITGLRINTSKYLYTSEWDFIWKSRLSSKVQDQIKLFTIKTILAKIFAAKFTEYLDLGGQTKMLFYQSIAAKSMDRTMKKMMNRSSGITARFLDNTVENTIEYYLLNDHQVKEVQLPQLSSSRNMMDKVRHRIAKKKHKVRMKELDESDDWKVFEPIKNEELGQLSQLYDTKEELGQIQDPNDQLGSFSNIPEGVTPWSEIEREHPGTLPEPTKPEWYIEGSMYVPDYGIDSFGPVYFDSEEKCNRKRSQAVSSGVSVCPCTKVYRNKQ